MSYPKEMTREVINQVFEGMGENVLLMDGFDGALIGYTQRMNEPFVSVYSYDLMINICVERDGMTEEEAMEYVDFNCVGAWVGEKTPIIVMSLVY